MAIFKNINYQAKWAQNDAAVSYKIARGEMEYMTRHGYRYEVARLSFVETAASASDRARIAREMMGIKPSDYEWECR